MPKRPRSNIPCSMGGLNYGMDAFTVIMGPFRKKQYTKQPLSLSFCFMEKDKKTIPMLLHASPIIHSGTVKGVRGIIVDMSKLKRMESQLQQAQKAALLMTTIINVHRHRQSVNGHGGSGAGFFSVGFSQ
jgi:hypothetical protein